MSAGIVSGKAQPGGALVNVKAVLVGLVALMASYFWTQHNTMALMGDWQWAWKPAHPPTMAMAQIVAVPLMTSVILVCIQAISHPTRRLYIPLAYALWFAVVFLSVAPGGFNEDTYYTVHMVRHGWWSGWYSAFHPLFITALLQILPSLSLAPGLALAIMWACTFASLHRTLFLLDAKRWMHLLLPLVLLLPPMLAATTIIIRDSYVCALFIVLLNLVFRAVALRDKRLLPPLWMIGLLAGVVACYRTDMLPSAALGLLVIAFAAPLTRWRRLVAVPATGVVLLLPFAAVIVLVHAIPSQLGTDWKVGDTWDPRAEDQYQLTLIENPLGHIAQQPSARFSQGDRVAIEKVFLLSDLAQHHCAINLCVFYGNFWRQASTAEERQAAYRAALHVFKRNPRLFVESRVATLAKVGDANTQTFNDPAVRAARGYPAVKIAPALTGLGTQITHYLTETEGRRGALGGSLVWWNIYAWFGLCLLPVFFVRKTPATAVFGALMSMRSFIVFLAAPASFTTYYLPCYIGGPMLLVLWAAEWRARSKRQVGFQALERAGVAA